MSEPKGGVKRAESYIVKVPRDFVLLTKYYSNDQTNEKEVGETCDTNGENRNACKILLGNPEGKSLHERRTRRW